jgi:hypothetical protein
MLERMDLKVKEMCTRSAILESTVEGLVEVDML